MILLMLCKMSYASSEPIDDVVFVPAGYTTLYPCYLFTEQSGKDTLVALRTYRKERDIWEEGYLALKNEHELYKKDVSERITSLEDILSQERNAWLKEQEKGKRIGLGIFAGPAVCSNGSIQMAVGVGLVWKIK